MRRLVGDIEARSVLWNFAINACAALIENNIIQDTSAGKVLAPRQDGNRDGMHYATSIRGLAAAEGQKVPLQSEPIVDDSLQAQIGGIGNEIHNLGCEHQNNEELAERLGELASRLWSLAASVASPAPQPNVLGKKHTGMKVDYRGLLNSARLGLRREPGIAEMLRQLEEHMTELGQRWYAGEAAVVDELLQLYCIESDARAALTASEGSTDV